MKARKLFQPIYAYDNMVSKKCKWCEDKILKIESVG